MNMRDPALTIAEVGVVLQLGSAGVSSWVPSRALDVTESLRAGNCRSLGDTIGPVGWLKAAMHFNPGLALVVGRALEEAMVSWCCCMVIICWRRT